MKNILKVDFSKNAIIMDRTFAKKCTDTRSEEYAQLQRVRQDYPTFAVLTRTIKRNENKETYKGLTYRYMEDYNIFIISYTQEGSGSDLKLTITNIEKVHSKSVSTSNQRRQLLSFGL